MREIALLTFITADGVMQAPRLPDEDSTGGFAHGGWAVPCWDEVMEQVGAEAMSEPYDLLLGRNTYDRFASSFSPDSENPMNKAVKYVATSHPDTLGWQNSVALTNDLPQRIGELKRQEGLLLQVHGSWQLARLLLAEGLVDLLRLWTFPVVVGTGKRLFENDSQPIDLELIKSEATPGGAVMSLYRRTG